MVKGSVGSAVEEAEVAAPARLPTPTAHAAHQRPRAGRKRSADMVCSLGGGIDELYSRSRNTRARLLGANLIDMGQGVSLAQGCVLPFPQGGILERMIQIRLGRGAQRQAVALKAEKDRREHGIGHAELPDQQPPPAPWACRQPEQMSLTGAMSASSCGVSGTR